jgi:excisionase family DNA binding protein
MPTLDTPELLTIRQAAKLINVHPNTLRNWEKEGRISAMRIGPRRDRRYLKSSLNDILQFTN